MKDYVGYTWQLVLSSQREHWLLFPGSNQILTRVILFGTDTRVWFSPLVQPPKQVGRFLIYYSRLSVPVGQICDCYLWIIRALFLANFPRLHHRTFGLSAVSAFRLGLVSS